MLEHILIAHSEQQLHLLDYRIVRMLDNLHLDIFIFKLLIVVVIFVFVLLLKSMKSTFVPEI